MTKNISYILIPDAFCKCTNKIEEFDVNKRLDVGYFVFHVKIVSEPIEYFRVITDFFGRYFFSL